MTNTSNNSSIPSLLVPISVNALVMGQQNQDLGNGFADIRANYSLLNNAQFLGNEIEPDFFTTGTNPGNGVHLQWALPDALTHSTPSETSDIDYPAVPNRWLIIRTSTIDGDTSETVASTAWVIVSDYLTDPTRSSGEDADYTLLPAIPGNGVNNFDDTYYTWLGESFDYPSNYPPSGGSYLDKLTAVGPGDPSFAAYYQSSKSVFGFYDPLENQSNASLTYLVIGWYSDSSNDILQQKPQGQSLEQYLENTLNWNLPAGTTYPDSLDESIYHGTITNIAWQGSSARYPGGPPVNPEIQVALGNTSVEALAALIKNQLPGDENIDRVLEAFQYDLLNKLDQPDGLAQLEMALHSQEFQAFPGGVTFLIERDPGSTGQESRSPNIPFPGDIGQQLSDINEQQSQLEKKQRELLSYQYQVYLAWYEYFMNVGGGPSPPVVESAAGGPTVPGGGSGSGGPSLPGGGSGSSGGGPSVPGGGSGSSGGGPSLPGGGGGSGDITLQQAQAVIDPLIQDINNLQTTIDAAITAIAHAQTALSASINKLMPGYILKPASGQRFWRPTDPVVLISGLDRSFRHGEDGRFDNENGNLQCRLDSQVISALEVMKDNTSFANVTSSSLSSYYPSNFTTGNVPSSLQALFLESSLLSNNMAEAIAIEAYKIATGNAPSQQEITGLEPGIISQQNTIWNGVSSTSLSVQALADQSGFTGTVPSKVSFDIWTENPWNPMFMEWEVNYFPTNSDSLPSNIPDALNNWTLAENDFDFGGSSVPSTNQIIQGRTLLTPHAVYNLQASINKYLQNHKGDPDYQELTDITNELSSLDILSQSIGGFNEALLMRELSLQFPVMAPSSIFGSDTYDLAEKVKTAIGDALELTPNPSAAFNPIRQGFFQVVKLWIVDSFGQILPLDNLEQKYAPLLSEELTTSGSTFDLYATLRPRFSQPLRMDFRWISAINDQVISNSDPSTGPVCGWLIFNHLESNVQVYDTNGVPLGSLVLFDNGSSTSTAWQPVPGALNQSDTPQIANTHLASFVNGLLLPASESEGALKSLMSNVDTIQTTVNPAGGKYDNNLAVLMGRPIAVTRASIDLALGELPAYSLSLDDYGKQKTEDFTEVNVPVRLGDTAKVNDGLMGYFAADDYTTYYTTYAPADNDSSYISADHLIEVSPSTSASPVFVTMLVDPTAGVHANCGLLPVKYIDIPNQHIQTALENMSVTFLTTPILTNPASFAIPVPSEKDYQWSWIYPSTTTDWQHISDFNPVVTNAVFSDQLPTILEGWLKLSPDKGLILQSSGNSWGVVSAAGAGNISLNAVVGSSANDLMAVGIQKSQQAGTLTETTSSLMLRYNGNDWFIDPGFVLDNVALNDIYQPTSGQYYAVGGSSTEPVLLTYNNSQWSQVTLPVSKGQLYSVWGTGTDQVFAAGADENGNSLILQYNGTSWTQMTVPANGAIRSIQGTSADNVYAVGDAFVLQYDGTAWTQQNIPALDSIRGIWAQNDTSVFITGSNTNHQPAILKFIGNDWITIDCLPTGQNTLTGSINTIWGPGDGTLLAVGQSGSQAMMLSYDGKKWSSELWLAGTVLNGLLGLTGENIIAVGG